MAYNNSKDALKQENELLGKLLDVTNAHIKTLKPGSLGEFIAKDWAGSFSKLGKLGVEIATDDEKFRKTLVDEITLLARLLAVTQKMGFGKSWAELFTRDIQIATYLLADIATVEQAEE